MSAIFLSYIATKLYSFIANVGRRTKQNLLLLGVIYHHQKRWDLKMYNSNKSLQFES